MKILGEAKAITEILRNGDLDDLRTCIANTKELFRGTSGLGMSYYIGYKPRYTGLGAAGAAGGAPSWTRPRGGARP